MNPSRPVNNTSFGNQVVPFQENPQDQLNTFSQEDLNEDRSLQNEIITRPVIIEDKELKKRELFEKMFSPKMEEFGWARFPENTPLRHVVLFEALRIYSEAKKNSGELKKRFFGSLIECFSNPKCALKENFKEICGCFEEMGVEVTKHRALLDFIRMLINSEFFRCDDYTLSNFIKTTKTGSKEVISQQLVLLKHLFNPFRSTANSFVKISERLNRVSQGKKGVLHFEKRGSKKPITIEGEEFEIYQKFMKSINRFKMIFCSEQSNIELCFSLFQKNIEGNFLTKSLLQTGIEFENTLIFYVRFVKDLHEQVELYVRQISMLFPETGLEVKKELEKPLMSFMDIFPEINSKLLVENSEKTISDNSVVDENLRKFKSGFEKLFSSLNGINNLLSDISKVAKENARSQIKNKFQFSGKNGDQECNLFFQEIIGIYTGMQKELEHALWILNAFRECSAVLLESSAPEQKQKDSDWKTLFAEEIDQEEKIQQRKKLRSQAKWKSSTPVISQEKFEKSLKRDYSAPIAGKFKFEKKEKQVKSSVDQLQNIETQSIKEFGLKPLENKLAHFQMMEAVRDAYYHQAIFLSCIDLWRSSDSLPESLLFSMVRSAALMTEQWMIAKAIQKKGDVILSHEHLELLAELPEFEKYRCLLAQLNKGSIYVRYPNQSLKAFDQEKDAPTGLQVLLGKCKFESIEIFVEELNSFFDNVLNMRLKEKLPLLEKEQTLFHRLKIAEKIEKQQLTIESRIEKYKKEVEKHNLSKDFKGQKKAAMCKDIVWHLEGLSNALKAMEKSPQTRFLFLHGDRILTHLQYINELIRSHECFEKEGVSIRSHDLEFLENLSHPNVSEERKEMTTVRDLNTIYGAQYPNRRIGSIQGYNRTDEGYESPVKVPDSIFWRLNTKELMVSGDEVDMEMTHNSQKKKTNNKSKFKDLYTNLVQWIDDILAIS